MKYNGYSAVVEFDVESGVLFGRVVGLRDVVTFQGTSVSEVSQAFRDSVDDYLDFCAKRGESPEKPYSGHFVVRVNPELHRAMAQAAEKQSVSLNSLVEESLRRVFAAEAVGGAGKGMFRRPSPVGRRGTKAVKASKAAKNRKRG